MATARSRVSREPAIAGSWGERRRGRQVLTGSGEGPPARDAAQLGDAAGREPAGRQQQRHDPGAVLANVVG